MAETTSGSASAHEPQRNPVHCIIPPFVLDALERNGTPAEQVLARQTNQLSESIRDARAAAPAAPAVAELAPPRKQRKIFDARHTTNLPGTLVRNEGGSATADADVNRVFDGFGATWDLYFDIFGRNSYDNQGATLVGTVHYSTNFDNAFWNGSQMVFGDGDGTHFRTFTSPVDIMGHELTHAVTQHESNLAYQDQSGALNESLSDVFGIMVKQRSAKPPLTAAASDWLIGAGIWAPGINGVALRSMKAPGTAFNDPVIGRDLQPDHMSRFVHTTNDNGGVHINSGIPNKAFFLFATALGGFAWDRAGRVWYAAATDDSLGSNADFQRFAEVTTNWAYELFGFGVAKACADAWAGVGITVRPIRHIDRSAQYQTAPDSGAPSGVVVPGLHVANVAYRDNAGHLHELWRDANGATGTTDLTANAGAPAAAGNPFAYVDTTRNTEILLFRSGEGTVRSLYWSLGAVGHDNLSGTAHAPSADGDPVGHYDSARDTHHVIYRGGDGHLHELFWVGVQPVAYGGNLTGTIHAPRSAGDPTAMVNGSGYNIVAYRAVDGRILSVYWADGPSGLDDLSGVAGTPHAIDDPVGYYLAASNTTQIVYQGTDGHLWELWWVGDQPVAGWNLTAPVGGPRAAGRPAAYYSQATNTKHVVYRATNGHVVEIWWVPGGPPSLNDLTTVAGAPTAADRPTAFTVDGPNTQHVAYPAGDRHIHELAWM